MVYPHNVYDINNSLSYMENDYAYSICVDYTSALYWKKTITTSAVKFTLF